MEKDFFINAVQMVEVEGSANIPTALFYSRSRTVLFGSAALAEAEPEQLNEDFKIDLGYIDPDSKSPRTRFFTAAGIPKSAAELTADFIHEIVNNSRHWMSQQGLKQAKSVLVAEPITLEGREVPKEWLENYRDNLRRILRGKGFDTVEFLPEPFAVFQYYRYGARHPLVAQRMKQNVFVIDFGGGTCDLCVIETTRAGDINISHAHRTAKPFSAKSVLVGGFFINRVIAEDLLTEFLGPKSHARLRRGIEFYAKWRRGREELSDYSPEYQNFVKKFHALTHTVENPKLTICRSVRDWRLDSTLDLKVPALIPSDPFSADSENQTAYLSAQRLRELFVEKVWRRHLKPGVEETLRRSRSELEGAPILVVLLSGGSANIGWLRELILADFGNQELQGADILPLPDYQEVVAKGLAVECARRFYNETGDFSAVTYNRLCLILDPDETGYQLGRFQSQTADLANVQETPGLLLPSATVVENLVGKSMRWKVRLSRSPNKRLKYFFLRSSFDPEDAKNLYNVEEQVVHTPPNCPFDSKMQVELTVMEDGTAKPMFVYRVGSNQYPEVSAKGRPFFLDMTTVRDTSRAPEAYIGIDFGTSNSAISFVDQNSVKVYRLRSEEAKWRGFTELVDCLPYPLADSLARYLSQTDEARLAGSAFEFAETALALAAYTAYLEMCAHKGRAKTTILKGFTKRSAGPLLKLLRESLAQLGKSARISAAYQKLITQDFYTEIDSTVTLFSQQKHNKAPQESLNHLRFVKILANVSAEMFSTVRFGYFEDIKKIKFGTGFRGLFRHAHGKPPFTTVSTYSGSESFSEADAMLVLPDDGTIVPMRPLVFWDSCKKHSDLQPPGHCYFYDSPSKSGNEFTYKAVGFPCSIEIAPSDESGPLADQLIALRKEDGSISTFSGKFENESS